jgi:hypothetical protein
MVKEGIVDLEERKGYEKLNCECHKLLEFLNCA